MAGQWEEVVRIEFKGKRFRDHALDLMALARLSEFQKMVAETAKALWRRAHPERERLPRHFEDRTRLCLRKIEEGSAVAPLEVYIDEPEQRPLWEPEPKELNEAIDLAYQIFEAAEKDTPLPDRFPKDLLNEYASWGTALADDEEIGVYPPGRKPARVTAQSSNRLASFYEGPHQDRVEINGEVLEADVKQGRFQLWLDEKAHVRVNFSPEQEEKVTTALKEHRSLRMKVKGRGELSPEGMLLRVMEADELEIYAAGEIPFDRSARPIEEVLRELAGEVPQEEWDKLPHDLTDNLDHYLYGTPKR